MAPNEEISLDEEELRRLLEQPAEAESAPDGVADGARASSDDEDAPAATLGQNTIDELLAQARETAGESAGATATAAATRREASPEHREAPGASATTMAPPRTRPPVTVQPAQFAPLGGETSRRARNPVADLGILLNVPLRITVELGRAEMSVREILNLGPGSVIELDRSAGEVLDVLVNGTLIAQGEVVVVDEQFGIRLTHVYSPNKDLFDGMGGE